MRCPSTARYLESQSESEVFVSLPQLEQTGAAEARTATLPTQQSDALKAARNGSQNVVHQLEQRCCMVLIPLQTMNMLT